MTVGQEVNGEVLDRRTGFEHQGIVRASRPEPVDAIERPDLLRHRVLLGELLEKGVKPTPQLLQGLLYEGKIHSIAGAAGDGKTLLALWMALRVIDQGFSVLYLDAENGPKVVAERLAMMEADLNALDRLFYYLPADLTLDPDSLAVLRATVAEVQPALVVFDSLADFLAEAGLDENNNTDCTRWFAAVAQPLKDAGVASLVLDHVSKSGKGGPRGASSKVAKLDALWEVEVSRRFNRDRTGEIKLTSTKDRESWLPKTARFSFGGGVFTRSVETREEPDPEMHMTGSGRKVHDALRRAGEEGARRCELERSPGLSKGTVQRGL